MNKITKNRSGYILLITIIFVIWVAVASVAIYFYAYQSARTVGQNEVERIRGYYAAVAGLRYAATLDIANLTLPFTKKASQDAVFYANLGLHNSEDVIINIAYNPNDPTNSTYTVSATYTSFAGGMTLTINQLNLNNKVCPVSVPAPITNPADDLTQSPCFFDSVENYGVIFNLNGIPLNTTNNGLNLGISCTKSYSGKIQVAVQQDGSSANIPTNWTVVQ